MFDVLSTFENKQPTTRRHSLIPNALSNDKNQPALPKEDEFSTKKMNQQYLVPDFPKKQLIKTNTVNKMDDELLSLIDISNNHSRLRRGASLIPQSDIARQYSSGNNNNFSSKNPIDNDFNVFIKENAINSMEKMNQLSSNGSLWQKNNQLIQNEAQQARPSTRRRESMQNVLQNEQKMALLPEVSPRLQLEDVNVNRQHQNDIKSFRNDEKLDFPSENLNVKIKNTIQEPKEISQKQQNINSNSNNQEIEKIKMVLSEKDRTIDVKNKEIDVLKESFKNQESSYKELIRALKTQNDKELNMIQTIHKRELDFQQKSNEQLINNYIEQINRLQGLLEEKGLEKTTIQEGFLNIERRINMKSVNDKTDEFESKNNLKMSQIQMQMNLELQVEQLNGIIKNLISKESNEKNTLEHFNQQLNNKRLELHERESKIMENECRFNDKVEKAKIMLESQREDLMFEEQKVRHLENEYKNKLKTIEIEDFQTKNRKTTVLKNQEQYVFMLNEKVKENEGLKLELLKKEELLNTKLKEVFDFEETNRVKVNQVQLQEQNYLYENRAIQIQKRTLDEKEKQLRTLQEKLDLEAERISSLNQEVAASIMKNQVLQRTQDFTKNVIEHSKFDDIGLKMTQHNLNMKELTSNKNDLFLETIKSYNKNHLERTKFKNTAKVGFCSETNQFGLQKPPVSFFDLDAFVHKINQH